MHKGKFIFALGLFNAAIFLLVALSLPRKGSFGWTSALSYFINSRTDWHIAFGVLIATLLISSGLYLLVRSFQNRPPTDA